MKKQTTPKCLYEVLEYEHKGIKIAVAIDHKSSNISLIENDNVSFPPLRKKNFIFAERSLKYMAGWQNILDAMKYAIGEATKILEKDNKEKTKSLEELIIKEAKNIKYGELK